MTPTTPSSKRSDLTNGAVVPACGLPAWVVCQLDAMISAGVVRGEVIDALDPDELSELARAAMRHALDGFDARAVVAALTDAEACAA